MPDCTIEAAIKRAAQTLRELDSPRLEAESLLGYVLDKNRAYFRTWPESVLTDAQWKRFGELVEKRAQGVPLAYLTGQREFWSLDLHVTPATLIPRPETELLVEKALARIPPERHWHIADLGTGSGAIALALASERSRCHLHATDLSSAALAVAQDNAQRLQLSNVQFYQGSWCEALPPQRFHVIVSNPPYVSEHDPHLLDDGLPFEPRSALTPGGDGLAAIRAISRQARSFLQPPGWLLLEHGYDQGEAVRSILSRDGYQNIRTCEDLAGNSRLTLAQHQHGSGTE